MYRIYLINAPFASIQRPSLALTQLKAIVEERYLDEVSVEILYLNLDFAAYLGVELYQEIAEGEHYQCGLGDWFFRQVAFPELPDNTKEYFQRYYPYSHEQARTWKATIQEKRQHLDEYLENILARYKLDQANLVGFTSMFSQNVACFAIAKKIKSENPGVVIVMGGANCETPMGKEIIRNVADIDFVFSGPALISFPTFIGVCLSNNMNACHCIDGVFSKINGASLYKSASVEPSAPITIQEIGQELNINVTIPLNYEPFLDRFEAQFANTDIFPVLLFETSRGCWWGERSHCTFCGLNGLSMQYRSMTSNRAREHIKSLFEYYPRCRFFECVDNILPKHYLKEVLPTLTPPPEVSIFYEVKANLSEEEVQVLANAQVRTIQPGIESLATSTLRLMKKGTSVFQNIQLLKSCVQYGVHPAWNLLVGFPEEGEEVYKKYLHDIPLLTHLPPPLGIFPVRFDRYSPYFLQQERYHLQLRPFDFYELTYPFNEEVLENLAYYFIDHHFNAAYQMQMAKWLGRLRTAFNQWKSFWEENEKTVSPTLFLMESSPQPTIYDSRSGQISQYEITEIGKRILLQLQRPTRTADLITRIDGVSVSYLKQELMMLQERGLVFHEDEKLLSLVLPYNPFT